MRTLRRGFTMLEMMIALAVAMVVVVGLYGVFTLQSRQFLYQDLQMEMHQNLRFGTDMLTRSVRMAGFGTSTMVSGIYGEGSYDDFLPALIPYDNVGANGSDAITVVYGDPSLVVSSSVLSVETCDTSSIAFRNTMLDYGQRLAEYQEDELLLCLDYAALSGMESYLWAITGIDTTTSPTETIVKVARNDVYDDYHALCMDNLTPVMTCSKGHVLTFYIDDTSDGVGPGSEDHPVLMLDLNLSWPANDDVPLVDNVEDMQISYCLDDGTDSADCSTSAAWTGDDETVDFSIADGEMPWMVRISLVVRSSREDPARLHESSRPDLENNTGSGDTDHYFRQVLTTESTARNLRYQAVL